MKKYKYKGPVTLFGKCVANNWNAETYAPSDKKALSNFRYQFALCVKINPNNSGIEVFYKNMTVVE